MIKLLDIKEPIFILGAHPDIFTDLEFLKEFNEKRIKKKIPLKIIFSVKSKDIKKINDFVYTEAKYLNYGSNSYLASIVVRDCVYHLTHRNNRVVLIKIKQKDIAREQRFHFDHAWKKATKM